MQAAAGSVPLVRASGLSVAYGSVRALDNLDLEIHDGEIVALAGENGAGKSTLVRCIAGDMSPDSGSLWVGGEMVGADPRAAARLGVAVVWQDLSLCDNLDIAANILLGREPKRFLMSATRFHERAARILADHGIRLPPTTTPVSNLSGGQRQLVAVARAMRDRPRLLVLDEPTASLGVAESARVEELAVSLPSQGTTVMIVTHDLDQMFRVADRILVMRRGRMVAEVKPQESHPDEVAALLSGQTLDDSARRQLTRLHSLADQLATAEPSTSLELIMSALGAALDVDQLCVHVREGSGLRLAGSIGVPPRLAGILERLPTGPPGGQVGRVAASGSAVLSSDVRSDPDWQQFRAEVRAAGVGSSWSIPFTGAAGDSGVVTVMSPGRRDPTRDDLELAALYAGYAANALERDRLLGEATARNAVLEAIRDVLQALAGPATFDSALKTALGVMRNGLGASEVGLVVVAEGMTAARAFSGEGEPPAYMLEAASLARGLAGEVVSQPVLSDRDGRTVVTLFPSPTGRLALVTRWDVPGGPGGPGASGGSGEGGPVDGARHGSEALIEDAAHSLRLAFEREASETARREAIALRRSQEQQRQFLSFLSHELRTPLTAIRGYASSLMSTDVDWDGVSQKRFLGRISDESARLGRLVEDLLDFSAIDAGIMRLQPDWCDIRLIAEAARDCLPEVARNSVAVDCEADLPVVWADHDRLEQVLVNLLDNAVRHNPPGTRVTLAAEQGAPGEITVTVADDGVGVAEEDTGERGPRRRPERRSRTGGAGLGLSIARGIVVEHGGTLRVERRTPGTACVIALPIAHETPAEPEAAARPL